MLKNKKKIIILSIIIMIIAVSLGGFIASKTIFKEQTQKTKEKLEDNRKEEQEDTDDVSNELDNEDEKNEETSNETNSEVNSNVALPDNNSSSSSSNSNNSGTSNKNNSSNNNSSNSNSSNNSNGSIDNSVPSINETPLMSWQILDFSVSKYGSKENAMLQCQNKGNQYLDSHSYFCTDVVNTDGNFIGYMLRLKELNTGIDFNWR